MQEGIEVHALDALTKIRCPPITYDAKYQWDNMNIQIRSLDNFNQNIRSFTAHELDLCPSLVLAYNMKRSL